MGKDNEFFVIHTIHLALAAALAADSLANLPESLIIGLDTICQHIRQALK